MRKIKKYLCMVIALLMICSANLSPAAAAYYPEPQARQSISQAITYFHNIQNHDGGFPAQSGRSSNMALTCWVVLALAAAGENVVDNSWAPQGHNPVEFIRSSQSSGETTDYGRLLLALSAAGQEPIHQNTDLVAKLVSLQQASGQFAQPDKGEKGFINAHMWSVLALNSAGRQIPQPDQAKQWLLQQQNNDGGFSWIEGSPSDADDTGVAIQTLVVLGENPAVSDSIQKVLQYLKKCQTNEGGFTPGDQWMGSKANAATDAWVIQGLIAAGQDPAGNEWTINGKNPVTHLISLQNGDGSFNWTTGVSSSPVTMTAYAVMALAGQPFPIKSAYGPGPVVNPGPRNFSDLPTAYWAYAEVMDLVNQGVLSGYPDGTFKPDQTVTRAEFTRYILGGLKQSDDSLNGIHQFPDVLPDYWAYHNILLSADKGYVAGFPNGTFQPEGEISGAELATILVKALPADKKTSLATGAFWYSGYVQLAAQNRLLYPDFQPELSATRAQCAYSVDQLLRMLPQ